MTASRAQILKRIGVNKPTEAATLPDYGPTVDTGDRTRDFIQSVQAVNGVVVECRPDDVNAAIERAVKEFEKVIVVSEWGATDERYSVMPDAARDLAEVDMFICDGALGVAENGAIWVDEEQCVNRAALFLPENTGFVISRDSIVSTMHEAYAQLSLDRIGWGAFVAGPSKTADIEQSLVIGAHGPRSLTVFLAG